MRYNIEAARQHRDKLKSFIEPLRNAGKCLKFIQSEINDLNREIANAVQKEKAAI